MAVSVRAACSMPHLHSLDFDLSPKGHYSRDVRWGNSSPVLILNLLEIVEQDSVHMQEAAPRLKPGWVRNACAAFEQGVPFSNVDDVGKLQSNQNCLQSSKTASPETKETTKNPATSHEEPLTKQRLSKAKSLDSLHSHKPFPKKRRVPTPKELRRHASFSPSSTAARKEVPQAFCKPKNSQYSQDHGLSKPISARFPLKSRNLQSTIVKTQLKAKSESTTNSTLGDIPGKDCHCENAVSSPLEAPTELITEDAQAISVASIELGKSIAPMASLSDQLELHHPASLKETINAPSDGSVAKLPISFVADVNNLHGLPNDSEQKLVREAITVSSHTNESVVPGVSSANLAPSGALHSCQDELDMVKIGEEHHCTATKTTSEDKSESITDTEKEAAVKPNIRGSHRNLELHQPSLDTVEKLTDGAFSDCVVQCNNRAIKVSIRSSSVPKRKTAVVHEDGQREGVVDQSAMNKCVMSLQVKGGSYTHSNLDIVDRRRGNWSANRGYSLRVADRWEFPLDKLEAFLVVKEAFKLGMSLTWSNCHIYFNSHRELSVPRQRFSNTCSISTPEQSIVFNAPIDHLKDVKKALAKKWSRPNELIERRKAQLKEAKLSFFRYQLLTHPLVYFDCYEVDESESDSDVHEDDVSTFTYFSLIPTYIIAKIFSFLNTRDLAALKCTCTDFHWLINQFDITGRDSMWNMGPEYRNDPCMHCGKIRDPRGDVSLCRRHTKMYYNYSHIGRRYWTCCNAVNRGTMGCQLGLHNNRWTTATFRPNVICRPWKSRAWFVTANHELWCDKEHL